MKIFQIFRNNQDNIVFLEESFSFKALIFQALWLIYHRLWSFVIIVIIINVLLISLQKFSLLNYQSISLLQLLISIIIASFAKSWYKDKLLKQGYFLSSLLAANNIEEAKLRYYSLIEGDGDDIRQE